MKPPIKKPADKKKQQTVSDKRNLHELLFLLCYSEPRLAYEIFKRIFSKEELAVFDWDELKSEKNTFPNNTRADLVFSVPFKKEPSKKAKLFLILEHKSDFDPKTYLQVLKYKLFTMIENFKNKEKDSLVLSALFYHGKKPWKGDKSFKKEFWGNILPKIPSSLAKDLVDYNMRIFDTHSLKAKEAIKDENVKSRGFLNLLKNGWYLKPEKQLLKDTIELFANWTGDKEQLVLTIWRYFDKFMPDMGEELWNEVSSFAVKRGIFKKGGNMNIKDYIREEAREEARKEGMLAGRQEGILAGRQEGILAGRQEGILAGRQEGILAGRQELVLNMLKEKIDLNLVCKITGLSEKEIKELKNGS